MATRARGVIHVPRDLFKASIKGKLRVDLYTAVWWYTCMCGVESVHLRGVRGEIGEREGLENF